MKHYILLFLLVSLAQTSLKANSSDKSKKPFNVLFICVDDLTQQLNCAGVKAVISPNIDKLASEGVYFRNHFVQVPTCGASRYALMTGRRPHSSASKNNGAFYQLKKVVPGKAQTLPELFRNNGYTTVGIGKLSHQPDCKMYAYNGKGDGRQEMPGAWDRTDMPYGKWKYGWGSFFAYGDGKHREDKKGYRPVMEFPDCADDELPDGLNTEHAIKALKTLKEEGKPFFLGLGLYKPHLPFVAPKKYLDLYKDRDVQIAKNQSANSNYRNVKSGEFFKYQFNFDKTKKPLSEVDQITSRKAYYACVTYIDTLIGKVLKELKKLELEDNTIVVLWGDHGWFLGDHQSWGKHSVMDSAVSSPLIIRTPGIKGGHSKAIVETLDIFPTLLNLCKLKNTSTLHPLSGVNLEPVLKD